MSDLNALTLEPGEVVGGYTLISRLGSGAMGSVWRVSDGGGQVYAMKILRDSLSDDDAGAGNGGAPQDPNLKENVTARERLRREAMALKKVNHPGVCGIVDMELDDALAFIVTELIEGKNLRDDVNANGRYVGDDLERLARKLIEAVKAVHAAGIVHRDIKPTNVMVSATGPILVDFGIAMGEGESHVTRTGLVMGTPGFIAPEIIEGAESDEATDWWSVASVLAFAAMGEPVFGTKPMMAVLEREASGNANLAGLPTHTLTAFRSALNPDPAKRCTPDQLLHAIALDALAPLTSGQSGQPGQPGQPGQSGQSGNEVMPPFGRDDDGHTDNGRDDDSVSTRTLWPGASGDTNATAVLGDTGSSALAATRALTPDQCTVALPSDRLGPDDIPGLLCPPPPPGATKVMPTETKVMPVETGNPTARPALRRIANNADRADMGGASASNTGTTGAGTGAGTGTAADARSPRVAQSGQFAQVRPQTPAARPQTPASRPQTPADVPPAYVPATKEPQQTTVMSPIPLHPAQQNVPTPEPLFPQQRTPQSAQYPAQPTAQPVPQSPADLERTTAIQGTVPEFLRTQDMQTPSPMTPMDRTPMDRDWQGADDARFPGQPGHANAADLLRDRYLSRGTLPIVVMAVIPAIAAVVWPVAGPIAAAVMFWLLFTVGYSDTAQLDRESRRGGERRGSDTALRMVQLPWHLVKGLLAAIARTAQFTLVDVLCMAFAVVTLRLPWEPTPTPGGYWPYQVPWLADDGPFTPTSLVAAGLAAVVWIVVALWPYSATLRLAAGAMRGRADA